MSGIHDLTTLGQSMWYDYIRRFFLTRGELKAFIHQGIRGVTSNPSIFESAIAGSADYDEDLRRLAEEGKSIDEIYEGLTLEGRPPP